MAAAHRQLSEYVSKQYRFYFNIALETLQEKLTEVEEGAAAPAAGEGAAAPAAAAPAAAAPAAGAGAETKFLKK